MKKTALTILLTVAAAVSAYSQSAYDAYLFSENNYEGTARSVAMGNAFTALGGDLGAVSINPAGSAVAGYSQFALTPALTISSSTSTGVPAPGSNSLQYFEKSYRENAVRANIPNLGISLNFDTGRRTGLKSLTFGFILNRTNSWCEDVYANGTNNTTSFAAAAAAAATDNIAYYNEILPPEEPRYSSADFTNQNAYDYYSPWSDIVGYNSGMFSSYDDAKEKFIGATEILLGGDEIMQGGPLNQTYGRTVDGSKYEYTFNLGANISDFVYIGFNLGINSLTYDMAEYFKEEAKDTRDFQNKFIDKNGAEHITYFREMIYRSSYSATGSGVFGKLGIIVTPGNGLRIGAAIQTPTANTIEERWQDRASTSYVDSKFDGKANSPIGENEFRFNSPFRANAGIAYTFGKVALISVDYELADYRTMKYKIDRYNMSSDDIDYFESVNQVIRQTYGVAHQFRAGVELKPLSTLALRAGYNLSTSGEKYDMDKNKLEPYLRHNVALGLGFNSKKSFFIDLACRYSLARAEYYIPYNDYQFNGDEIVNYTPEILIKTSDWKVLLTMGWRF